MNDKRFEWFRIENRLYIDSSDQLNELIEPEWVIVKYIEDGKGQHVLVDKKHPHSTSDPSLVEDSDIEMLLEGMEEINRDAWNDDDPRKSLRSCARTSDEHLKAFYLKYPRFNTH